MKGEVVLMSIRWVELIDAKNPEAVVGLQGTVYKLRAGKSAEVTYRSAAASSHLDLPLLWAPIHHWITITRLANDSRSRHKSS